MQEADLYVQTLAHEGFCITLGEAKVFGLPIVSANCAGACEQLDGREKVRIVERNKNEIFAGDFGIVGRLRGEVYADYQRDRTGL